MWRDPCGACEIDRQQQRPARARHGIRHLWWWRRLLAGDLTPRGRWAYYVPEFACRPVWRLRCRLLNQHGAACRGRRDHIRNDGAVIDPGRWY